MSLFMNRIMNFMYREIKMQIIWKVKYEFVYEQDYELHV